MKPRKKHRAIDPLALTDSDIAIVWSIMVQVNWEGLTPGQLRMVKAFRDEVKSSLVLPGELP